MEMHYKEFRDILNQLSSELYEFNLLELKRFANGCLSRKEQLKYERLERSFPELLSKIQGVDKIYFRSSVKNSYLELKNTFLKSSYN